MGLALPWPLVPETVPMSQRAWASWVRATHPLPLLFPEACSQNTNRSCEECLKNVSCLWCNTNKACLDYPVTRILPPSSLCTLSSARWGVCWVNFEALIITLSVVGGAVLLALAACCCACCCRRKRSRKPDKEEEKAAREREERRVRQEERRAEMKSRHDEIRKKYGLFKEENPYARFENN
ncbi:pituitary tumor-transforming gene 1 protein-interacting protein isoform X2 [Herpailurus yagouaroundi]|uniref:pituitary tumor-transforming gene 1 protein-interacting protein isoform X2 n=1 Tax=Herpailurus yagouaroundi TaxID=1608482 RepID=UPI001AD70FD3|nr:pituitary tumor-transforming gene 1 protein-interacting protein isoform X2 [Puma yagouaroundi]